MAAYDKLTPPTTGSKITIGPDGSLKVPNDPIIPFIEGDGIGIDITPPMKDVARRRRHAAAVFLDRPDAGLREVARAAGLSPATVRDVRQRIQRGEDPVPDRYRDTRRAERAAVVQGTRRTPQPAVRAETSGQQQLLARLGEDPSLRLTEAGRRALRWLRHYSVDDEGIAALERGLPCHWAAEVADLAHGYAAAWSRLAHQLLRRAA